MKRTITFLLICFAVNAFSQIDPEETEVSAVKANGVTKRVLIEEATGTWCGYCVRGIVKMGELDKAYSATVSLIAVHNDDPMMDATYDAGMGPKITGYPSGLVDRQSKEVDPASFKTEYLKRINYVPVIDVFIDNVSWNASTRLLSFRVNASTVANFNGSYRFNAAITEMQVHGTTSKYAQHNYYSNNANGAMGGFETKPDPVPAADMYYDYVGRAALGGWDGTAGSIPATNASGQTISYTYTKTVPATWKESNLSIIGFVINSSNGTVENASLTVKLSSVITGMDVNAKADLMAYPNPTNGMVNIENAAAMDITVFDVTGTQVLKTQKNTTQIDLSDLSNGIYFLQFNNQEETYTKKFVLLK
jgi:hypothetical protein